MGTVWVLKKDNDPDLEVFRDYELAFANYREHIDDRTTGADWLDSEFEWEDSSHKGLRKLSCCFYGEFVASLQEAMIKDK